MNREEAIKTLQELWRETNDSWYEEVYNMAIEALGAKCPTCKWCSDHQESGTRCPIEEHYVLPKDGYCHLYEPYRKEQSDD